MTPPPRRHRADLDGLRAVAVLAVVVHHVAPAAFPAGFAGVDVFFVLSGFLITGILADECAAGDFAWLAFLHRRARRLLPALLAVLGATGLLGALLLTGPELASLATHAIASALSAENLLLWREVGYFDGAAEAKPLLHLWSLGVEEQFYLAWPPLLVALSAARARRWRLAATIALATASFALALVRGAGDASEAFYLLHTRAWELLAGAALALAQRDVVQRDGERHDAARRPRRMLATVASLGGAALLVATAIVVTPERQWPGATTLLPVLGTVALIAAGPAAPVNRTLLARPVARWLGVRSYPFYLWHWPLLALLHVVGPDVGITGRAAVWSAAALACLALALADVTWRVVEQPAQRRAIARTAGRVVRGADLRPWALALGAVVAVAAAIRAGDGLPWRYRGGRPDAARIVAAADRDSIAAIQRAGARCVPERETRQNSWCVRSRVDRPVRVAVLGDSHAEAVHAVLAGTLDDAVLLVGRPGCAPLLLPYAVERDSPDARLRTRCRRAVRRAHALIDTHPSVHTVVLAARDAYLLEGRPFGRESGLPILAVRTDPARPDTAVLARLWDEGMGATVERLQRAGKRVILVVDHPELGFDPRDCVLGRPLGLRAVRMPCAVSRAAVEARTARYRAAVARLQTRFPALEVHDAAAALCDADACGALRGDTLRWTDDDHLALAGARIAYAGLAARIAAGVPLVARRR